MRFSPSPRVFHAITVVFLTVFVCVPSVARAAVIFTEVMYDAPGTDSGHEWVEVCNTGTSAVTLSDWRLREADTDHKIVAVDTSAGGGSLPAGICAVIADNPATFQADTAGYTGKLFDSSFSLNNAGETLILRDADLVDEDLLAYDVSIGGAGDDNTLSRTSSGGWLATAPNPGVWNVSALPIAVTDDSSNVGEAVATSEWKPVPAVYAYAGSDMSAFTGVRALFTGSAATASKKVIEDATFDWNFGDGATAVGKSVYHTYVYPGTYRAVVSVTSGGATVTDTCTVSVSAADIVISAVTVGPDAYVEMQNGSSRDIDISSWYIHAGVSSFRLPDHTYLAANTKTRFPAVATNVRPLRPEDVTLLRPDLSVAAVYSVPTTVAPVVPIVTEASSGAVATPVVSPRPSPPQLTVIPVTSSFGGGNTVSPSFAETPDKSFVTIGEMGDSASVQQEDAGAAIPSVRNAILASAAATGSPERSFWYIVLGGIIILGVAGVFIASGEGKVRVVAGEQIVVSEETNEADEYDILE